MNWNRKVEDLDICKEGDLKITRKFAWWPTPVGNKTVWLESYEILWEWTVHDRTHYMGGGSWLTIPKCGAWDEKQRRLKPKGKQPLDFLKEVLNKLNKVQ